MKTAKARTAAVTLTCPYCNQEMLGTYGAYMIATDELPDACSECDKRVAIPKTARIE